LNQSYFGLSFTVARQNAFATLAICNHATPRRTERRASANGSCSRCHPPSASNQRCAEIDSLKSPRPLRLPGNPRTSISVNKP
jgi:hypothetical protein